MMVVRTLFVVAALAAVGSAGQAPAAGVKPLAAVRPSETALSGTIDRFDAPQRKLVLETKEGRVVFTVASDAIVWFGSSKLRPADIAGHRGRRAKVRYTQVEGIRTAHWVFISTESPKSST